MRVSDLRATRWSTLPAVPGVYWWYFPEAAVEQFQVAQWCNLAAIRLRRSDEGRVCLYHGMAKSLSQRIEWHAAQPLSLGALRSGFLSTFRLTLLAINDFNYLLGSLEIDRFMDGLDVVWQAHPSADAAAEHERKELAAGTFHYPLNIQANRHPELAAFVGHLKATRKAYKRRYLQSTAAVESPTRAT